MKQSFVYQHFLLSKDKLEYKCKILSDNIKCDTTISNKNANNSSKIPCHTSNLKRHLKTFHKEVYYSVIDMDLENINQNKKIKKNVNVFFSQTYYIEQVICQYV